jgi:hypothetical protein
MLTRFSAFGSRLSAKGVTAVLAVLALVVAAVPSFATDPTFDYTTALTTAETQLGVDLGAVLPPVLIVIAAFCVLKLLIKYFRRSIKSA